MKALRHEIGSIQRDMEDIRNKKLDKTDLKKIIDDKVNVRDLTDALERTFREVNKDI